MAHVTDDLDLYAAGWLEGDERAAVEGHLATCADCRAALVPPERMVWALAEAAARPAPAALRDRVVGAHRRRWSWSVPRLAFAAVVAVGVVIAAGLSSGGRVVALDASAGASGRAAVVVVPGGSGYLFLAAPTPPPGKAYEAWIIRDGTPLPAGVGGPGGGVYVLALTTPPHPGDIAAVTLEVAGGVARPTSDPVLLGKL